MSSVTLTMEADRGDHKPRLVTYQGATDRTLTVTIMEGGAVKDLTDLTVTLTARLGGINGYVKFGSAAMTVASPTSGVATITPTATQVAEAGELDAQIMFEDQSGNYDYTQIFRLVVLPVVDVRMNTLDGDGTEFTVQ